MQEIEKISLEENWLKLSDIWSKNSYLPNAAENSELSYYLWLILEVFRPHFDDGSCFGIDGNVTQLPDVIWKTIIDNFDLFISDSIEREDLYPQLLMDFLKIPSCPREFFYKAYNSTLNPPKIDYYLQSKQDEYSVFHESGNLKNYIPSLNSKRVKLSAWAERNTDMSNILIAVISTPSCPREILHAVSQNEKFSKAKEKAISILEHGYEIDNNDINNQIESQILSSKNIPWRNPALVIDSSFGAIELSTTFNTIFMQEEDVINLLTEENPDTLRGYSNTTDEKKKAFLARNTNCPKDVFVKLATDDRFMVRLNCFCNTNCPPEAFYANINEGFGIYDCVMMFCHPNCPDIIVDEIIDKNYSYIGLLAQEYCCNFSKPTLKRMITQYNNDYCWEIRSTINKISRLMTSSNFSFELAMECIDEKDNFSTCTLLLLLMRDYYNTIQKGGVIEDKPKVAQIAI